MDMVQKVKKCNDCKDFVFLEEFYNKKDRLDHICKICRKTRNKQYYQKNKEKEIDRNRNWRARNKNKKYYQKHKEKEEIL